VYVRGIVSVACVNDLGECKGAKPRGSSDKRISSRSTKVVLVTISKTSGGMASSVQTRSTQSQNVFKMVWPLVVLMCPTAKICHDVVLETRSCASLGRGTHLDHPMLALTLSWIAEPPVAIGKLSTRTF